ncbi:MAG TPA: ABC transporter permease [Clostridia bacterium]|nr:ABC transporter permease [Clostridia bacterium]
MRLFQIVRLAMKNILNNKLRSALTMIGIIIGISSVIVMVALGSGASETVTAQVESLGTNLIIVSVSGTRSKQVTLNTIEDIRALNGVADIAPVMSAGATLRKDRYSEKTSITGTTRGFLDIRGMEISSGRFLSDMDTELRQNVVVLGSDMAQELFGFDDPIGGNVHINGITYQVIGILKPQGSGIGGNTDDMVIVPATKAETISGDTSINTMYVKAENDEAVDFTVSEIDRYLINYFKPYTDTHNVSSQKQLLETMNIITGTLTMLLGGIAAISLIVGGIGVMNVMLVSVSERTKEIGIRKALGGKRKDILTQFLIEALVLSSIGGICGIFLGISVSGVLSALGLPSAYSAYIVVLSFTFSLIVGIIFGIFPAYKASKLNPIDALRYE